MEQQIGVIAQEIKSVLPQAVFTRDDGFQYVSYASLNALLIEGFKENLAKLNYLFQNSNRVSDDTLWIHNLIYGSMPEMGTQEENIENLHALIQVICDTSKIYFYLMLLVWILYCFYVVKQQDEI